MKIWFGTTTLQFKEYKDYYLNIRQYLIDEGHILTDDWIGEHGTWLEQNPNASRDIKSVYQAVITAIDKSDVSIIEFTVPNFSTSHQITYSLQTGKPTLVMRLKKDNTFKDSYIEALDSPYLHLVNYNGENFKETIDEFLGYACIEEGQGRYNILLDKKHKYYLDWASEKYKKSKSALLRAFIAEKMQEDVNFKSYIKKI